jgi:hypothetical protein
MHRVVNCCIRWQGLVSSITQPPSCTRQEPMSARYKVGWVPQLLWVWWHRENVCSQGWTLVLTLLTKPLQLQVKVHGHVNFVGWTQIHLYLVTVLQSCTECSWNSAVTSSEHSSISKRDSWLVEESQFIVHFKKLVLYSVGSYTEQDTDVVFVPNFNSSTVCGMHMQFWEWTV